jgi:hypothetical protein
MIYDKIDAIFGDENIDLDTPPKWAKELLEEIQSVKKILNQTNTRTKKIQTDIYIFIEEFKNELKPNITNNIYPTIRYKAQELAINENNKLFDIHTQKEIPTLDAFNAYKYFLEYGYTLNYANIS